MANQLAIRLDRAGLAEMSCIAGVGGGVAGLVRTARSGRRILALDGCVLACVKACLAQAGVEADRHLVLSDYGVRKRKHADVDQEQASQVYAEHVRPEAQALLATLAAAARETGDADVALQSTQGRAC